MARGEARPGANFALDDDAGVAGRDSFDESQTAQERLGSPYEIETREVLHAHGDRRAVAESASQGRAILDNGNIKINATDAYQLFVRK